jgi:omega-6 fatty acid desaturase (delta-12 desaturase)
METGTQIASTPRQRAREKMRDLLQATKPYAQEDLAVTWRLWFETLAVWFAFWALTFPWAPMWMRVFSSIMTGFVTVRLFIFYHDYLHGAIFRNSTAAKFPMWLFGSLILNPPEVWRRSHNYHHQNNSQIATASIGSFPVMTLDQYREATLMQRFMYRASRHWLTMVMGYIFVFILGMCVKSFVTDPKRHWDSAASLVIHFVLLAAFIALGQGIWFWSYILPIVVSCCAGAYLFYIQHNFPDMQLVMRADWDYVHAALKSSSFLDTNPVMHWLTGNIGYHHVHHLNPQIPFYRLPDAMAGIEALQQPGTTTLKPVDIYRCLNLTVWHAGERRMLNSRALRGYLRQPLAVPA